MKSMLLTIIYLILTAFLMTCGGTFTIVVSDTVNSLDSVGVRAFFNGKIDLSNLSNFVNQTKA